ncbi:right-handed parallel beta-helix repeat-containing protein [Streptosporangiaceae bacterium NEAU-GS5]|nr:right-handed parallel beta-helix repeat-containing protein [Streptosporangiaceae bacterium NEAU-GS5]
MGKRRTVAGLVGSLVAMAGVGLTDSGVHDLVNVRMMAASDSTPLRGPGMVTCPAATKTVGTADALRRALASARAGDVIRLRPGTYRGAFVARSSGTRNKPIFLCGGAGAVLRGKGVRSGYGLHLDRVSYWRLVGFSVVGSQKGVVADRTRASVIQGLTVHEIGDEGIHLRAFSSGNWVQYNRIHDTGQRRAKFGEGVYLGSAKSNWGRYSGGRMDRSDGNLVRGNVIRSTAEAVDVKEGTRGGRIVGNVFDGSALTREGGDSWVDVKGNGYLIEGNIGKTTPQDGFQTHQIIDGWGTGNTFRRNTIDLNGGKGVGINDTAGGNSIACDNTMVGGGRLTRKGSCA